MPAPRYLTKSRFKLAIECPTKLFYTSNKAYKNTKNEDSFLAFLADGGFQVGELAKLMFSGGHEVATKVHSDAEEETRKLLEQEHVVLFEPAIRYGNLFIRIDILVKRGNTFELIEVKAKSYHPEKARFTGARGQILSEWLPYIQDVAFQKYVLQGVFPSASISSYLLLPDKSKRATVDGLNQLFRVKRTDNRVEVILDPRAATQARGESILTKVNVDPIIDSIFDTGVEFPGNTLPLPDAATLWAKAYENDVRVDPALGSHCGKCEFRAAPEEKLRSGFHECWRQVAELADSDFSKGTVLDLYNFRGKDKLITQGVYTLTQVQETDLKVKNDGYGLTLSERQWMQVAGIPTKEDKGGFYLDKEYVANEIAGWQFPYHFIDFETSGVALPFYLGMRPYESVAFQFSHHSMSHDGHVQHIDECLLVEPGQFPNYAFTRALKKSLEGDDGSVFMWHHHENSILNAISIQLKEDPNPPSDKDQLIEFLEGLTKGGRRAMIDLCAIAKKSYFHPDTKGSSSIKRVLPAILKTSEFLRAKYSLPIYGAVNGISSKNYKNFIWWRSENGVVVDPYDLLKDAAKQMLGEELGGANDDDIEIAEGGAAAAAFSRLQYELLAEKSRGDIKAALLRYCELDTLAMVMIVEAWRSELSC